MRTKLVVTREKPGFSDSTLTEFERFNHERRPAGQIPGIALKSVVNGVACSGRTSDPERQIGKESHPQQVIEADQVIDMKMRKEKPSDLQEVSRLETEERPAIEKNETSHVLRLNQESGVVKRAAGRL